MGQRNSEYHCFLYKKQIPLLIAIINRKLVTIAETGN